jgi:hypothetical protein
MKKRTDDKDTGRFSEQLSRLWNSTAYIDPMTCPKRSRAELLGLLRTHELELRAIGVETITLFGSMAREQATDS